MDDSFESDHDALIFPQCILRDSFHTSSDSSKQLNLTLDTSLSSLYEDNLDVLNIGADIPSIFDNDNEVSEMPQTVATEPGSSVVSDTIENQENIQKSSDKKECGEQKHFCEICGLVVHHLLDHIAVEHYISEVYKCSECSYDTNSQLSLQKHKETNHCSTKIFNCTICDFSSGEMLTYRNHLRTCHETEGVEYSCTYCDYKAKTKECLYTHVKELHREDAIHQCQQCKFKTKYKSHLSLHIKTKHKENTDTVHKCEKCTFSTKWKSHLYKHIKEKHSNIKEFKTYNCQSCEFVTRWQSHLYLHRKTQHPGIIYKREHRRKKFEPNETNSEDYQEQWEDANNMEDVTETTNETGKRSDTFASAWVDYLTNFMELSLNDIDLAPTGDITTEVSINQNTEEIVNTSNSKNMSNYDTEIENKRKTEISMMDDVSKEISSTETLRNVNTDYNQVKHKNDTNVRESVNDGETLIVQKSKEKSNTQSFKTVSNDNLQVENTIETITPKTALVCKEIPRMKILMNAETNLEETKNKDVKYAKKSGNIAIELQVNHPVKDKINIGEIEEMANDFNSVKNEIDTKKPEIAALPECVPNTRRSGNVIVYNQDMSTDEKDVRKTENIVIKSKITQKSKERMNIPKIKKIGRVDIINTDKPTLIISKESRNTRKLRTFNTVYGQSKNENEKNAESAQKPKEYVNLRGIKGINDTDKNVKINTKEDEIDIESKELPKTRSGSIETYKQDMNKDGMNLRKRKIILTEPQIKKTKDRNNNSFEVERQMNAERRNLIVVLNKIPNMETLNRVEVDYKQSKNRDEINEDTQIDSQIIRNLKENKGITIEDNEFGNQIDCKKRKLVVVLNKIPNMKLRIAETNQEQHQNNNLYKCDICNFKAKRMSLLKGHLQRKHSHDKY